MSFLQALSSSFQNDLLICLSLCAGCAVFAACLEPRRGKNLRIAVSLVIAFGWMVATNWFISTHRAGAAFYLSRYAVLYTIFGFSLNFWAKASFLQSLFAVTVAYSIQNLCERLIEIPRNSLPDFPLPADRICLAIMMAVCVFVYYRFLIGKHRQSSVANLLNQGSSYRMLLVGVGVVLFSFWMDIQLREYSDGADIGLQNCHNLISATLSFLTVLICMSHLRETDSEHRAEISEYLLYSERARYEREKQIHDAINIKCHDIRHQIAALGEAGYREELGRIGKLVDIYDAAPRTQNSALDVVLSNKMLACGNQGITLTCLADGRRMDFMDSSDIYALFGNILDNAIDATSCIQDPEKRLISLSVGTTGDLLMIESRNFYVNEVAFIEGLPQTSKADKDYHGYGMRSIRMITEKYGGDLQLRAENGIFYLSIMFPIPA